MTGALLWKEYREQRAVWLALAAVAALTLVGLPAVFAPEGLLPDSMFAEVLRMAAVSLAWLYGMVCGGMLLAGEREENTLNFLDCLPARRWQLWWRKVVIGLALLAGQIGLVGSLALRTGLFEKGDSRVVLHPPALLAGGLLGFAWAMFYSARGISVLDVLGKAVVGQAVAGLAVALVVYVSALVVTAAIMLPPVADPTLLVVDWTVLTLVPAFGSAWRFCEPDRSRRPSPRAPLATGLGLRGWLRLLGATLWQARRRALVLAVLAVLAGFLLPDYSLYTWPVATLLVGLSCGMAVYRRKPPANPFRLLDEAPGTAGTYLVRFGVYLGLAVALCLLILLPGVVARTRSELNHGSGEKGIGASLAACFEDRLYGDVVPLRVFLLLWLPHGFACGLLAGGMFRRGVTAFLGGLAAAVVLTGVWVPSLLAGGLRLGPVLGVPVLLLFAAPLLRAANVDWITSRRLAMRIGVLSAACLAWGVVCLWDRVHEIPDLAEPEDMTAYLASLPGPGENGGGELVLKTLRTVVARKRTLGGLPTKQLFPDAPDEYLSFEYQMGQVVERGWPGGKPELAGWLDQMFAGNWTKDLDTAAALPSGIVEDPRHLTLTSTHRSLNGVDTVPLLLAVRGLQRQAEGDPHLFVEHLRLGLTLACNLRNRAPLLPVLFATRVEMNLWRCLEHWLERLDGNSPELRQALAVLLAHEKASPDDYHATAQAEILMLRNSLQRPGSLLIDDFSLKGPPQAKLIAWAWGMPWERERMRRIANVLLYERDEEKRRAMQKQAPRALGALTHFDSLISRSRTNRRTCGLHAAELKVALRLYQAETGRPAKTLQALVPHYLDAIPTDPFDGMAFRYRLSHGERIEWPADGVDVGGDDAAVQVRVVPPGQGILWSVGEDGHDDDARLQAVGGESTPGEDRIYLVPLPPPGPKGRGAAGRKEGGR